MSDDLTDHPLYGVDRIDWLESEIDELRDKLDDLNDPYKYRTRHKNMVREIEALIERFK